MVRCFDWPHWFHDGLRTRYTSGKYGVSSHLIISCTPATMQPFTWSMQSADTAPWALRTRSQAIPSALCREWIGNKLVVKTGAGHLGFLVSQKPLLLSFCFWMVSIVFFFFGVFSRLQLGERDIRFSFSKSVFQGTRFLSLISLSIFIFAPGLWLDRVGVLHVRKNRGCFAGYVCSVFCMTSCDVSK